MGEQADQKIWKYMDFARFISLLTTRSLYFASPLRFQDPWEGALPKSHIQAISKMLQDSCIAPMLALRSQFAARSSEAAQQFDFVMETLKGRLSTAPNEATLRFGVNCWHKSDGESDAMWKLYAASGKGIAIESTIGQLKAALGDVENVIIDSVRYADFESDPIEKGHKHYGLFLKRRCFEHEKELRATILLPEAQWQLPELKRGISINCDLDILIACIHISPLCEDYIFEAVRTLCAGKAHSLDKPVMHSELLKKQRYEINWPDQLA